jgi:hypothetical protein
VDLPIIPEWLYWTLWTADSPALKEIVISISNCSPAAGLRTAMDEEDWREVDEYLHFMAKSRPSFKVAFRVGSEGGEDCVVRNIIEGHFPLTSNRGVVRIECATL